MLFRSGMSSYVLFSYGDVICGRATLKQAAATHPIVKNLYLLTAPATFDEKDALNPKNINAFLKYARRHFSYILIDSAAGIGSINVAFGSNSDKCVIVSTPDETSLRGGQIMASKLFESGCDDIKLVVNRVKKGSVKKGDCPNIDTAMNTTGLPLLGIVPEDKEVPKCANAQKIMLLYSDGKAIKAYNNIAKRLLGAEVRLLKI